MPHSQAWYYVVLWRGLVLIKCQIQPCDVYNKILVLIEELPMLTHNMGRWLADGMKLIGIPTMTNSEWTNATMETWVAPGMPRCIDLSLCNETLFNRFGASLMPLTYVFHGRQFITIGGAYIHNTWCCYVLYVREGFWAPFSIDAIVHWIGWVMCKSDRDCAGPRGVCDVNYWTAPHFTLPFPEHVKECLSRKSRPDTISVSVPLPYVEDSFSLYKPLSWFLIIHDPGLALFVSPALFCCKYSVNWSATTSMKTPIQKTFAASSLSLSVRVDIRLSASGASPLK